MRYRSNCFILCCILCVSLTLLSACHPHSPGKEITGESNGTSFANDSYPIPKENRKGVNGGEICLSSATNGYYLCLDSVIQYYEAESGMTITLCVQPGCSHRDTPCQAWVGDVTSYTEYHGSLFAIVKDESNTVRFLQKDLSDGRISVLDTWESSENDFYSASIVSLADQTAVINLLCYTTSIENGVITTQQQRSYWWYNLDNGQNREILSDEQTQELEILAISENHLVVQYTPQDQTLLEPEEFASRFGESASYGRYLHRATKHELRLYDMDTFAYTVVASTEQDHFAPTVDPYCVYGKEVVYQCGDTIYLLNADTGETKPLLTLENIVNYWVMDKKVFLITQNLDYYISSDSNLEVSVCYAALDSGNVVKLKNGGNTKNMEFSISQEGTSFFVGHWMGGSYIIRKSDFYADQYESAKRIG